MINKKLIKRTKDIIDGGLHIIRDSIAREEWELLLFLS